MRYLVIAVALVLMAGAAHSDSCVFRVSTAHGVDQFAIGGQGTDLLYFVQPRNSSGWYWVNNNGSPFGVLATGGLGPNGWRDGSKTFAGTDVAYGQPLNSIKLRFSYYMPVGVTGWNYPSINFFVTDGLGRYGIWAPASGGAQYFVPVRNGDWMTINMDLTDSALVDTLGGFAMYEHNGFTNDFSQPFTYMQWGGIKNYKLAGFYDYQRNPAYGWSSWGSVWDTISASWCPFVIRNATTSGNPPQINSTYVGSVPALEFLITEGGMKAGWGTKALDGKKVRDIAGYVERLDDYTRFPVGGGPYVAPYFNIWVTDGAGKYAVIGNEPSNSEWTSVPGSSRNFDWDVLKTKVAKAYETTDMSWLPKNGVGMKFDDLADYTILAPTPAELAAGWPGLGGGAPRELGTNKAYGFAWIVGDTLSNYISGDPGYILANPAVTAGGPVFNEYGITLNWGDTVCSAGSGYDLYQRWIKDVVVTVQGTEYNALFESDQTAPNLLELIPTDDSIYIKPGEGILVDMNVSNLQQKVNACQAVLGYSSTFFADPTGGCVQVPGGSVWDQVIWDSWSDSTGVPGEIDTAIGVNAQGAVGTDADGTICKILLTSRTGVEGVTQMIFRPDVSDVESTFLSDMSANPVWPAKVNSTNIYIDGTAPVVNSFSAAPLCTKTTTTLTFDVADAVSGGASGVDYVDVYVDNVLIAHDVASGYVLDMSGYATETCHDVKIRVVDKAGNETDSGVQSVCVDKTAPVISNIRAEQSGSSVLCGEGYAVQSFFDIYVDVEDPGCADLVTPPTVTIDGISPVVPQGNSGNTYHYKAEVISTTDNGSHTITVNAEDSLGNASSDNSKAVCVDKNQVTGTVSFSTLSTASYSFTRNVVFVATDAGGTVLKSWTIPVDFTNDTGTKVASGEYKLLLAPAGMANLSAKTNWSLRKKEAASLDDDGQSTTNFVLLGGDLNGTNSVNVLDYSILKVNWYTAGAVADINGDGGVGSLDYDIMKSNWFVTGENL